ncbi:MAG: hypothetical protein RIS70_1297 [Planctomycetota bacterium]|jgi:hypothetical protein
MSGQVIDSVDLPSEEVADYRAVSRPAVFSLTLGILSVTSVLGVGMLLIPFLGIVFGLIGLRSIRRYPEEYSGKVAAWIGLVASTIFLFGSAGLHAYEYSTEVPEGFERVAFYQLLPDPDRPNEAVPSEVLKLDGKKVFIKGYVHPSVKEMGAVKQFVLVGDMKQCCFGGPPKVMEFVNVDIVGKDQVRYSWRLRKLAGILRVDPSKARTNGLEGPCYSLEAEYVR